MGTMDADTSRPAVGNSPAEDNAAEDNPAEDGGCVPAPQDGSAPRAAAPAGWPASWTGDALEVAPRLLGVLVAHGGVVLRLTELEAYRGGEDPASHAHRGRTQRNAAMFGPPGHLYVYLSYGIHRAANFVTTPEGVASGVLLRAGEVVAGLDAARARRPGVADALLARGPGNLGRTLGLDLADTGRRLRVCRDADELMALAPDEVGVAAGRRPDVVRTGPRVGVGAAHDEPWRFWIEGEPSVSAYRRQGPRTPRTGRRPGAGSDGVDAVRP